MLSRKHEMIGDYRIQEFNFASPENASHWKGTFPVRCPSTHEWRYRHGVDPLTRVPFVRFGLYLKNAPVAPGTIRFALIEQTAPAAETNEPPTEEQRVAAAAETEHQKILAELRNMTPAALATEAAMHEIVTKHKNNRDKDVAIVIDELAKKLLAHRRAEASEPATAAAR